jgi:hypothetical protein
MTKFRLKLAAIMLDTALNTASGSDEIEDNRVEGAIDPDDCDMLDSSQALLYELKAKVDNMTIKEAATGICEYSLCPKISAYLTF